MGTSSWVLVGTAKAMELTFGSTAHGAGRMISRSAAKRQFWGGDIKNALEKRGITVRAASASVLAEEADPAYKNVDMVADVSDYGGHEGDGETYKVYLPLRFHGGTRSVEGYHS